MRFELTKHNFNNVLKALSYIGCREIIVNDVSLSGVKKVVINKGKEYLDDLDTVGTDIITMIFEFENGIAYQSFRPDIEHCEITFDAEELWIVRIEGLKPYLERRKAGIDVKLQEYEEVMKR